MNDVTQIAHEVKNHLLSQYDLSKINKVTFSKFKEGDFKTVRPTLIDASWEGYDFSSWYKYFHRHNPENVLFISGNLDEKEIYDEWCNKHGYHYRATIMPLSVFITFMKNQELGNNYGAEHRIFLSLSRRPRIHRNAFQYLLYQNDLHCLGYLSQLTLKEHEINKTTIRYGLSKSHIEFFNHDHIVDRPDFETNWADDNSHSIRKSCIFECVLETLMESPGVFYSEKTFKPIVFEMPFLILGNRFINQRIAELGFKTYEDWFDLSFDEETNPEKRLKGYYSEISKTIHKLQRMDMGERLSWKNLNKEVIKDNKKTLYNDMWNKNQVLKIFEPWYNYHR